MQQKQTKVTDKVRDILRTNSYGPATREMRRVAADSLLEAVLNVTPNHEDAPELVLVLRHVSLSEASLLASTFGMTEVGLFGGREPGKKYSSCIEISGYVDGEDFE